MKTHIPLGTVSVTAAANISRHLFIGFDGNLCGANAKSLGVCAADSSAGEQMPVIISGVALVIAGAAVTQGAAVVSNASGKAVAASAFAVAVPAGATPVTSTGAQPDLAESGSILPQAINGYAMDTASAPDEVIRILLV